MVEPTAAVTASAGTGVADRFATPAVIAGLSTPFTFAAIALVAYLTTERPADRVVFVGVAPPALAGRPRSQV